MSDTYVERVLRGESLWTDIDDYVAEWHRQRPGKPLHAYLGMSRDDYGLWVEQPRALRLILAARERDEPVVELLRRADEHAVAARGLSAEDAKIVRQWLQRTGRLPKD